MIEESNVFEKVEIFPNPFFEKISIKNLPTALAEISIFDLSGKLVFEKEKPAGVSKIEVSTNNFLTGIFTI